MGSWNIVLATLPSLYSEKLNTGSLLCITPKLRWQYKKKPLLLLYLYHLRLLHYQHVYITYNNFLVSFNFHNISMHSSIQYLLISTLHISIFVAKICFDNTLSRPSEQIRLMILLLQCQCTSLLLFRNYFFTMQFLS